MLTPFLSGLDAQIIVYLRHKFLIYIGPNIIYCGDSVTMITMH